MLNSLNLNKQSISNYILLSLMFLSNFWFQKNKFHLQHYSSHYRSSK